MAAWTHCPGQFVLVPISITLPFGEYMIDNYATREITRSRSALRSPSLRRSCYPRCIQTRRKRGTWRLPRDDTPVERRRLARVVSEPTTSSRSALQDHGGSVTPPSRWTGLAGVRRPPPISIPASRLPVPPSEPRWSTEKLCPGSSPGREPAKGMIDGRPRRGAGQELTAGDYNENVVPNVASELREYEGEGSGHDSPDVRRHSSLASTRPSHRSFMSARSCASSDGNGAGHDVNGTGGGGSRDRRREGNSERDVAGSGSDSDLSDEFFDAVENDEDTARMGGEGEAEREGIFRAWPPHTRFCEGHHSTFVLVLVTRRTEDNIFLRHARNKTCAKFPT